MGGGGVGFDPGGGSRGASLGGLGMRAIVWAFLFRRSCSSIFRRAGLVMAPSCAFSPTSCGRDYNRYPIVTVLDGQFNAWTVSVPNSPVCTVIES